MSIKTETQFSFPEGFLWGSATSAYQVEGGIENCDWAQAAQEGRAPMAGMACDHYNRYEKDFDIAKLLGQNAHRFSIEWSRVEPEEGRFDEKEIEHYCKVLDALRERGLKPFVTLWHYTQPIWFSRRGGFENAKSPEIFSRYCEFVAARLGDRAEFWITMNEPLVFASMGYLDGKWPPFKKNFFRFIKVVDNLVTSHNMTYEKLKRINNNFKIGIAQPCTYFDGGKNPFFKLAVPFLTWLLNFRFLNRISKHQDFIGLNYYFRQKMGFGAKRADRIKASEDNPKTSDIGWEIYPLGIYRILMQLKKYGRPIFVTENGLADEKDAKRADFVRDHLFQVWRAIQKGVDVRGYFYWSLLDNFEWAEGFWPRFGLVEVDYETFERRIRPSAYEYAKICESNSLILKPSK